MDSKDSIMDAEWRTVQFFIDEHGVAEVQLEIEDNRDVRCSCIAFQSTNKCKHATYVINKVEDNNGNYGVLVPGEVPDEIAFEAMEDANDFREFVIRYGKALVLDDKGRLLE